MAAYVMISRLVHSQRPHIGGMLANGFTRRQVLWHYLGYGLVPGVVGAVPGAIVGMWLGRVITRVYTGLLSIPVTLVQFYPTTLIVALVLRSERQRCRGPRSRRGRVPASNLRKQCEAEAPAGRGHISLAERVLPPLRSLPIRWRMTLRGPGRNVRRTVYTIIGVVLSLMFVLVSWGMLDTVRAPSRSTVRGDSAAGRNGLLCVTGIARVNWMPLVSSRRYRRCRTGAGIARHADVATMLTTPRCSSRWTRTPRCTASRQPEATGSRCRTAGC